MNDHVDIGSVRLTVNDALTIVEILRDVEDRTTP